MNARSKSYTQILQAAAAAASTAEAAGGKSSSRGRKSLSSGGGPAGAAGGGGLAEKRTKSQISLKAKRSNSKSAVNNRRRQQEEEDEREKKEDEGWASATDESGSAAEEGEGVGAQKGASGKQSAEQQQARKEEESDSDDDALVVGIKKKPSKLTVQPKDRQNEKEKAAGDGETLKTPLARPQQPAAEPEPQLLPPSAVASTQSDSNAPQTPKSRSKQLLPQGEEGEDGDADAIEPSAPPSGQTRMERAASDGSDKTLAEGVSSLVIDPSAAGAAAGQGQGQGQAQQRVAFPSTTSPTFPSRSQQSSSSAAASSSGATLRSPTTAKVVGANNRAVSSPLARDHMSYHEDAHFPPSSDSTTTLSRSPQQRQPNPYRASYAGPDASPAGASVRSSKLSVRSRTSSLLPRDSVHAAAPMLDKHNALAGVLGSQYEERPGTKDMRRSSTMLAGDCE